MHLVEEKQYHLRVSSGFSLEMLNYLFSWAERSCFDREFAALGDKVPREICKSIRFMNLQW
jgi:hypothetical protein